MTMRDHTVGDSDRDPSAVVGAALDAGVTMVDTARLYGNEALVGRAIAGRRDEVLLATKFGVLWRDEGDWYVRADAAFVRESCEASLRTAGCGHDRSVLPAPPQRRDSGGGDRRRDGRPGPRGQDPRGGPVQRD